MQTERVTFLTSPDHKAALDAFAKDSGMSVGHVVREATSQFIAQPTAEQEAELELLVEEANKTIPRIIESLDSMIETVDGMRQNIRETLASLEHRG